MTVFNSSEKEQGKNSYNVRLPLLYQMWDCHITLPFRSLPGSTQLDRFAIAQLTHELVSLWWNFFWNTLVGGGWEPDKKKRRKRASSYTQVSSVSERRVRKPTKKKKAETSSPKHHKGFFAAAYMYMLFHRHVDEVTWKAHSQVAVTRTMEHRRQSNKKGSPTFPQLHAVSERTEPRVSEWRPRDRKWFNHSSSALEKSGKQWRQEELSFFLRGERWATARCRFRRTRKSRNTEVQDSGHSGDLPLDRAAAMSLPGFFFSEHPRFVELPQLARERVSTATGQPARQTAVDLGVQRREHGR